MKWLLRFVLRNWKPSPKQAKYISLLILVAALDDEHRKDYRRIRDSLNNPDDISMALFLLATCLDDQVKNTGED